MKNTKTRPDNVPAENEYHRLHWAVVLAYLCAFGAVAYLLLYAG